MNICNETAKPARYRTIKQCVAEIKKIDGDSAITEYFVRQLCKSNKIQYFASGNKSLVNFDSLLSYLGVIEIATPYRVAGMKYFKEYGGAR